MTRTIPIPSKVAVKLRDHLARFTAPGGDALVFVNTIGGRIDLSNFHRDVWKHAVAATFPTGPLRHVRRQDLRHAAITLWLNSGVPLKVAQTWNGHRTLSVLLDTYYGVMQHDEHVAYQRVEERLTRGPWKLRWGSSVWSGSCETLRQTAKSGGGPLWQDRTRPRPRATRRSTRAR